MNQDAAQALGDHIEIIETSYEFMLAYAAQGRDTEITGGDGPAIRQTLKDLSAALDKIAASTRVAADAAAPEGDFDDFLDVLEGDAARARAATRVALSAPAIGSQLVDNLNASIHLRALLTDLFLIDEALKSLGRQS